MLKIIIAIACGFVGLMVIFGIIAHAHGKKKEKKLDESIELLKKEREGLENEGNLTLLVEKDIPEQASVENLDLQEEMQPQKIEEEKQEQILEEEDLQDDDFDISSNKEFETLFSRKGKDAFDFPKMKKPLPKKNAEEDDFERFLDKHSYTRRIIDKNLLNKIKKLPPDVKAVLLSNIFTRPQD